MSKGKVRTKEFEKQVMDKEGVRVVLRAPLGQEFDPYNAKRSYKGSGLVSGFRRRLEKAIGDTPYELVDGYGEEPHGNTKMESLRNSFKDKQGS